MYSQCPECYALYTVRAAELAAARGMLRCSLCGSVFDALERLRDGAPASDQLRLKSTPGDAPPPSLEAWEPTLSPMTDEVGDLFMGAPTRRQRDRARPLATEIEDAATGDLPPFTAGPRTARRPRGGGNAWWMAATFLLSLALGAQAAYFWRDNLLTDPRTSALAAAVCDWFECEIPLRRNLQAIRMVDRSIGRHPSVDDALMITATLVNSSAETIAYPILEISLADFNGQTIALRRFTPEQYLDATVDPTAGMQPDSYTPVVFETVDPGSNAVAFEFKFM